MLLTMHDRTCTCHNCLPEDELSGSKHTHVEDIVKIIISLTDEYFVGLGCTIVLKSMVQKKITKFYIIKTSCENGAIRVIVHDVAQ
jgi:hypothetical protein